MKFLYADSLDYVDPNYNFIEDRSPPGRKPYWDDQFAHEYFETAPYDGVLISRGIVGDHKFAGKYTQAQAMRFRRQGARHFLRLDRPQHKDLMVMGDCGAFSFVGLDAPPYTISEIMEFYEDGGFSHGCSLDHIIFEFERGLSGLQPLSNPEAAEKAMHRYEITLENAQQFRTEASHLSKTFTPLGVIQGWSPGSMACAASELVKMGYDYLAVGGMVPLNAESIHIALEAIRRKIPQHVQLHILGFGKIDQLGEFLDYGISSIDTTSPLLRAFKDNRKNFFMPSKGVGLDYYTAIRIPDATESRGLEILKKKGYLTQAQLSAAEADALAALRALDKGQSNVHDTLDSVMRYSRQTLLDPKSGQAPSIKKMETLASEYERMLTDRPWQRCPCAVCQRVGVEVAIFRSSNRNKRRGFHNIWVFNEQMKKTIGKEHIDA